MFFMQMYKIFWHCRYFMVKIIEQGKKSISLYGLILSLGCILAILISDDF